MCGGESECCFPMHHTTAPPGSAGCASPQSSTHTVWIAATLHCVWCPCYTCFSTRLFIFIHYYTSHPTSSRSRLRATVRPVLAQVTELSLDSVACKAPALTTVAVTGREWCDDQLTEQNMHASWTDTTCSIATYASSTKWVRLRKSAQYH